jgi:uncharacterized protein YndB with AHSA1/START domain
MTTPTREGTLISIDGRPALRFERRYRHPIERVWQAISDPTEMGRWFPSDVEGDRAVGAELRFVDDDQRAAARQAGEPTRDDGPLLGGTVVAHDPPKVFSFTWGGELLRFELHADGAETVLVFTQVLSHSSVAARNAAGWHACLGALDTLLGAEPPRGDDWMAVYDDYIDRVGPALATTTSNGSLTWERATHVDPDRVRTATTEPAQLEAWGAKAHTGEPLHWEIEPADHGTVFRLVHDGINGHAELAATWHARLLQLDMWLAAGQLVPVDPTRWIPAYERVLDRGA